MSGNSRLLRIAGLEPFDQPVRLAPAILSQIEKLERTKMSDQLRQANFEESQSKENRMKVRNFAKWICILSALSVAMVTASPAQTFTVIKQLNGHNGGGPPAPPVAGRDVRLDGT